MVQVITLLLPVCVNKILLGHRHAHSLHFIYVWFHEIIAELKDFVVLVYFGFPRVCCCCCCCFILREDLSTKPRLASQFS